MSEKDMADAKRLRLKLREQLMPYRIWPDVMPWVDETIALALSAARREGVEGATHSTSMALGPWLQHFRGCTFNGFITCNCGLQKTLDALRARTTGGE